MPLLALLAACAVVATTRPAFARASEPLQPWEGVGANLADIYGYPYLLFQVSAVALTPPLVWGIDEPLQRSLQQDDPRADPFGEIASLMGIALPLATPASLYLTGLGLRDAELVTAASAAIQAVVLQFLIVGAYKWLTDRAGPYPDGDPAQSRWHGGLLRDSKRADDFDFNPFSLDGGLRWPSGHTASAVTLVSALFAFYPDETWLALVGYPAALAIGAGMIEGDYHWLSDVVAGALIGHAIGWVVGRNFRTRYDRAGDETARVEVSPELSVALGDGVVGVRVAGRFF